MAAQPQNGPSRKKFLELARKLDDKCDHHGL